MNAKLLLLVSYVLLVFCLISPSVHATMIIAPQIRIVPNPTFLGGLNSQYTISRFALIDNITFADGALWMATNNTVFSINVTDASDVYISINNWFDSYGTVFSVSKACNVQLNVSSKGEPNTVFGGSYTWNLSTKIVSLSIGGKRQVNLHWGVGGYSKIAMGVSWYHSGEGYKTCYGFGLPNMSWVKWYAYVYCPDGMSDVENATLELGDGTQLFYDSSKALSSERLSLKSDPNGYVEYDDKGNLASYDGNTKTLWLGWKTRFWNYKYPRTLQNTTLTVGSKTLGNVECEDFATYYFYPSESTYSIIDEYFMVGLGLAGLGMAIGSPAWAIVTLRKQGLEGADHAGLCMVLSLIGVGLIIIWLW